MAARLKTIAPVAVRVNPNVDAHTHAKITTGTYENKFGIPFESVEGVYARASKLKNLRLRGLQMHIGSQLTVTKPFARSGSKSGAAGVETERELRFRIPQHWRWSGDRLPACPRERGQILVGILYADNVLTPARYADAVVPSLKELGLRILVEPGRFIVGNAGILVTRVEYVKRTGHKNFVIVDAAMNDLIRPAFYDSYHEIVP